MSRKGKRPGDPLVREIREIRQRLWKEGGGTVKGLMRVVDQILDEYKADRGARRPKRGHRRRKAG